MYMSKINLIHSIKNGLSIFLTTSFLIALHHTKKHDRPKVKSNLLHQYTALCNFFKSSFLSVRCTVHQSSVLFTLRIYFHQSNNSTACRIVFGLASLDLNKPSHLSQSNHFTNWRLVPSRRLYNIHESAHVFNFFFREDDHATLLLHPFQYCYIG